MRSHRHTIIRTIKLMMKTQKTKLLSLLLLGFLLSSLSGCGPTLVASGAATEKVTSDPRSLSAMYEDQSIRHQIGLKLKDDPAFVSSHIIAASYKHTVLLAGQTPTASLREKAEKMTRTVPNVERIFNEITISGSTSPLTRSSDTWITTKLKTELLATQGLKTTRMKIVTENGTIYLMGVVTHKQADLAVDVARRIAGAQRVVKLFEYTKTENHFDDGGSKG